MQESDAGKSPPYLSEITPTQREHPARSARGSEKNRRMIKEGKRRIDSHLETIGSPAGAQTEKESSNKGERSREAQDAHSERRVGTPEDGVAHVSGGHQAHENRDPPFRPQLHLGPVPDAGKHGNWGDHRERGQRDGQHQREWKHDHILDRKLRGRRAEAARPVARCVPLSPGEIRARMAGIRLLQRPEQCQPTDAVSTVLRPEDVRPSASASGSASYGT